MRILDATAGSKTIWFEKNHPFVTFLDKRNEIINTHNENTKIKNGRIIKIKPDINAQWEYLPFKNESFDMIVFDPPHLIQKNKVKSTTIKARYGVFLTSEYKQILKTGIKELFRVLKPKGTFILKWAETDKPLEEILTFFPYEPMFGTRTGQANKNHWVVFIKYNLNKTLDVY